MIFSTCFFGYRKAAMQELNRCKLSALLVFLYRYTWLKRLCWKLANYFEGGQFYSATMREILKQYFDVEVGAYSYGSCMIPGEFPGGVKVGRFVSVASGVKVFLRNHPYKRLSMHPFFYNSALGYVKQDTITQNKLTIGHDVWLGYGAIITPGCNTIQNGAVIAAGSVVTKNVPAYAVVGGNPAEIIRYRFDEETIAKVEGSHWWEKSINELLPHSDNFLIDLKNVPPEMSGQFYNLYNK